MRFIQAANYHRGRVKKIRLIVVHDMEMPERPDTAEVCARMFATTTRPASAHYCVDSDSIVQCVRDEDTAWHAPGVNADGIGIEHAGYAAQSARDWADAYSEQMLRNSARLVADLCVKHGIPVRHLTNDELRAGKAGVIGHAQATAVYKLSTHTDPGPNFPWDHYIGLVAGYLNPPKPPAPKPPAPPTPPAPATNQGDDMFVIATTADAVNRINAGDVFQVGFGQRDHIISPAIWKALGGAAHPMPAADIAAQWPVDVRARANESA